MQNFLGMPSGHQHAHLPGNAFSPGWFLKEQTKPSFLSASGNNEAVPVTECVL